MELIAIQLLKNHTHNKAQKQAGDIIKVPAGMVNWFIQNKLGKKYIPPVTVKPAAAPAPAPADAPKA